MDNDKEVSQHRESSEELDNDNLPPNPMAISCSSPGAELYIPSQPAVPDECYPNRNVTRGSAVDLDQFRVMHQHY